MKKAMGYFTMTESVDAEIDVEMDDIIENLYHFSHNEIEELYDECESILNRRVRKDDSEFSITPTNLYDEQKMEYIAIIFNKMSLEELKKLADRLK